MACISMQMSRSEGVFMKKKKLKNFQKKKENRLNSENY